MSDSQNLPQNTSTNLSHPRIHFNNAGNPFFCDAQGQWHPYPSTLLAPEPTTVHAIQTTTATQSYTGPSLTPRVFMPRNTSVDPLDLAPQDPGEFCRIDTHSTSSSVAPENQGKRVDLVLPPLPESLDNDLSDGPSIARAIGHKPTTKIAGKRRASKSTAEKRKYESDGDDDDKVITKRGRPSGVGNYSKTDIKALLDCVQAELPLGQRGWKAVHTKYTKWARTQRRPERECKSLETKYKQLLKVTKPTGTAKRPLEVTRALSIDKLINDRAGTRDLSDSEFDGNGGTSAGDASSDDDIEVIENPKPSVRTVVARSDRSEAPQPRRNARSGSGLELVTKLSQAFDPSVTRARDEERAHRSLQNAQFLTLSQQLRDSQANIEAMWKQVTDLQARVHEADRARDRAELKLEMIGMSNMPTMSHARAKGRRHSGRMSRDVQKVRGKVRCEERYPEGGGFTYWITDTSSSDSDKENRAPIAKPQPQKFEMLSLPSSSVSLRHRSPFSIIRPPSPFHSAMVSPGAAPGLNIASTDLELPPLYNLPSSSSTPISDMELDDPDEEQDPGAVEPFFGNAGTAEQK